VTRTAIVTGSASGIGAAVAAALQKDGYTVAGLDIHPAAPYVVDVSDPAAVDQTVARVVAEHGPVDAVVSAAGHYEMVPISDITRQQLHRMLRVHLGGLRNVIREWTRWRGGSLDLALAVFAVMLLVLGMRAVLAVYVA